MRTCSEEVSLGVFVVKKEEVMELLYREMELEREVENLRVKLSRAGADLKILGEKLQENSEKVFSERWPEEKIPEGAWQVNFTEYQRFCDVAFLGQLVDLLHEKLAELEKVRKQLYFFRTKEKTPERRDWMVRQKGRSSPKNDAQTGS